MGEELEDQWGGYLVRSVGDADIKVGKVGFDEITDDNF